MVAGLAVAGEVVGLVVVDHGSRKAAANEMLVDVARLFKRVAGLEIVDGLLTEKTLDVYHLLPAVRGDLLEKLGRHKEARVEFERAASLTRNAAERTLLLRRAEEQG